MSFPNLPCWLALEENESSVPAWQRRRLGQGMQGWGTSLGGPKVGRRGGEESPSPQNPWTDPATTRQPAQHSWYRDTKGINSVQDPFPSKHLLPSFLDKFLQGKV